MGTKYMAMCSKYPYNSCAEHMIQEKRLVPFLIKLFKASRKYQIIDIQYRDC